MAVDTVVKNGILVSSHKRYAADIAIDHGKIVAMGSDNTIPEAKNTIDAKGKYVLPGLVEPHCHIVPLEGQDLAAVQRTETQAYAFGGVTTVMHQVLSPSNLVKGVRDYITDWEKNALIDLAITTEIRSKNNVKEIHQLADELGIVAPKLQLCYKGTDPATAHPSGNLPEDNFVAGSQVPDIDEGLGYLLFEEVGRLVREGYNLVCRVHCEFVDIFAALKARAIERGLEPRSWHEIRPRFMEEEAMQRLLFYAKLLGCPLYIVHMTIKEGVDIVKKAKAQGIKVTAETCPQYLVLNVDNVDRVLGKTVPPIRTREDNEGLWTGIRDGAISTVGTDHCPVRKEDKRDFWTGEVSMPGAETLLPIMLSEGVNRGRIRLEKLVELCCTNPARSFGLFPQKGTIAIGSDADLTVVDMNKEATVGDKGVYSLSDFSLFSGFRLKGWPVLTMLRGHVIMEQGKVFAEPGLGRYVPAKTKGK